MCYERQQGHKSWAAFNKNFVKFCLKLTPRIGQMILILTDQYTVSRCWCKKLLMLLVQTMLTPDKTKVMWVNHTVTWSLCPSCAIMLCCVKCASRGSCDFCSWSKAALETTFSEKWWKGAPWYLWGRNHARCLSGGSWDVWCGFKLGVKADKLLWISWLQIPAWGVSRSFHYEETQTSVTVSLSFWVL